MPKHVLASSLTSWHGWAWDGWSALVALGTILLAAATYWLVRATTKSVRTASEQIILERRNAEAAQWPRVVPAGPPDWVTFQGRYSSNVGTTSMVLPVKNLGPGVAYNVAGMLDFAREYGGSVHLANTSLSAGEVVDMRIKWAPAILPPTEVWDHAPGRLTYTDIAGRGWITNFTIYREGQHRFALVRETELANRADGRAVVPPDSLNPEAWYTDAAASHSEH